MGVIGAVLFSATLLATPLAAAVVSPTPTATPTPTVTATVTATATATATVTSTPAATPTITHTITASPSPAPTSPPAPTPTVTEPGRTQVVPVTTPAPEPTGWYVAAALVSMLGIASFAAAALLLARADTRWRRGLRAALEPAVTFTVSGLPTIMADTADRATLIAWGQANAQLLTCARALSVFSLTAPSARLRSNVHTVAASVESLRQACDRLMSFPTDTVGGGSAQLRVAQMQLVGALADQFRQAAADVAITVPVGAAGPGPARR